MKFIRSDAILTVRATDGDDVRTPNGRIDFVIDEGNREGYFRISCDPSGSGQAKIYPNRPLVGHYGNYTLRVMALDRGQPGNAAFADYNICVQVLCLLQCSCYITNLTNKFMF